MEQVTGQYHVFINHRGPDTKLNIASLIHRELKRCGLNVFLDREIRKGDTICPAIRAAIESASVNIVIFSRRYAESDWCLNELCWILNRSNKCTIIPVFYDVQPDDLRKTDGDPYADAFKVHQVEVDMKLVEEWKNALKKASRIAGHKFRTDKSDDASDYAEFLDDIVKNVLRVVRWESPDVAKYPVGLNEAFDDLENKIQQKPGTKVVGISGIGGIGKSTLARHFFKARRSDYSSSCYLSHVRENSLIYLQQQLCSDLANDTNIPNTDLGKTILRKILSGAKVLIVLDDVDDRKKIKCLLDIDDVAPGSLILITVRDKDILRCASANTLLYDVKPLEKKHARELFCNHAFLQSEPYEGYKALVEDFVNICEGSPLWLEIYGEQLAGKLDKTYWERQLESFSQGVPLPDAKDVIKPLTVSYEAMGMEEKELFLDIGCFFVGEDVELAVRVLEVLGFYDNVWNVLNSLRQKCLLKFDNDVESYHEIESRWQDVNPYQENRYSRQTSYKYGDTYVDLEFYLPRILRRASSKIIMQNQVRELARHIVRQDLRSKDKPLRLSCAIDIQKMLESQNGSDFCLVRGIRIPKGQNPTQLTNGVLTNSIKGLRLLVLEHPINLSSYFCSDISWDLVWLRLRSLGGVMSIPSTISLRSLRVLEFQGSTDHLENLFEKRKDEIPSGLLELNIDAEGGASASTANGQEFTMPSFYRFLGWIGTKLTYLNKIVLKDIPFLQSLPIDFSNLRDLRHLDLSGSTNITKLPTSVSQLLQLQHLALRDCKKLSIPTDILGEISTLEYIDFKGCDQLEHLPQGISSQTRLRSLNLLNTSLLELPLNLELLNKLEQLRIGSKQLTKVTGSVASLKGLKELILLECLKLDHIAPIEKLEHLERLEIYEAALQTISPLGILRLKNIKVLTIDCCPIAEFNFQTQHVMDALRDFTLRNTSISNICIPTDVCPRLEEVDLSYSLQLMQVQSFPSTLVRLTLEGCSKLKTLTNLSNLLHLRFLNINKCYKLETLDVQGMASLEEINAERCWKLQSIKAFNQLERVNFFHVSTYLHGRSFSNASDFESLMQCVVTNFENLQVQSVPATTTVKSPVRLDNVHSYRGIVMCFITNISSGNSFCVSFEPSNNLALYDVYKTFRGNRSRGEGSRGKMLHLYMWTEESKLFKDENLNTKVAVYKSGSGNGLDVQNHPQNVSFCHSSSGNGLDVQNLPQNVSFCHSDSGNELDGADGEKGWIVTSASKNQVLEVYRKIMYGCFLNGQGMSS